MQLSLAHEEFDPAPAGDAHYIPLLQFKPGELAALVHLPSALWSRVTPLIGLVGDREERGPFTDGRVRQWTKRVDQALHGHPFYVDLVRQAPMVAVAGAPPGSCLLPRLYERFRRRRATFIPVYQEAWRSAPAAGAVRDAYDVDGRGAALRVRVAGGLSSKGSCSDRAARAVSLLQLSPRDLDVFLDVGFVDRDSEPDLDGLEELVRSVVQIGPWRNVTVSSSTMPRAFSKQVVAPGSIGQLPRHERAIYVELRRRLPGIALRYSDYGIQHPDPPLEKGGPGMLPSIRYTTADATLVARGTEQVIKNGNAEYPDVCRRLMAHELFAGLGYSHGDDLIAQCGLGHAPPGPQTMWRESGTSHHLQQVLDELDSDRWS